MSVRLVRIDRNNSGQRIDNFLLTELKGVPKSRVYRILRKGEVRVNGGRIKPTYRLKLDDEVRIPPVRLAEREEQAVPAGVLKQLSESILYEDPQLLVLNKPSGLAVHGGSGVPYGVIETLRLLRPDASFLELVHRLDRETSGCLLIAKQRDALLALQRGLKEGGIEKRYLALLSGSWRGGPRRVDLPLAKNQLQGGERVVTVSDQGKDAVSYFTPLRDFSKLVPATLAEVEIKTGRTHQIRVHGAEIGHPLAGDRKYGNEIFNRQLRELGLKRLFLHAVQLRVTLDTTLQFDAPLPEALERLLEQL